MNRTRPAIAIGLSLAAVALCVRIGLQARALGDASADLALSQRMVDDYRSRAAAPLAPLLIMASRAETPADRMNQALRALGGGAVVVRDNGEAPAGGGLVLARFTADGQADAAFLDRLARWTDANRASVTLTAATLAAPSQGAPQAHVELSALVRPSSAAGGS